MPKLFALICCMLLALPASASNVAIKHIPDAAKVGSGTLSVLLWEVYDVTLYAPNGTWDRSKPFALSIDYKRTIDGADIAERSAKEIKKLGFTNDKQLAKWLSEMRTIFPNVTPKSNITGIYTPNGPTVFYHNAKRIGEINDPEFGTWFFDIWLSEKTPEPDLRAALLGR